MIKLICAIVMFICTIIIIVSNIKTFRIYKDVENKLDSMLNDITAKEEKNESDCNNL